ncbi:MAG: hypothetical protein H6709_24520 [Kofleriaceae bacterium]|nr:hypothetical protein [Myxococcales bacterium]MCB9564893.1 hypothetical protein [Kofleriaceae bacterium]MCB9575255.1 hypothetical protein [Kofleriaceae bacterium]
MRRTGSTFVVVAGALAIAGCGEHHRQAAPRQVIVPPSSEAQPAGADDPVVATVDGHPIYGSCVADQVRGLGVDRAAALDQCVAFELLAREADRRGLRSDPEVAETWKREMVRALIEADLGPLDRFDALPASFREAALRRLHTELDWPLLRGGHYARVEVPASVAPGAAEDVAAHDAAEAAYEQLRGEPAVLPDELLAVTKRLAPGFKVSGSAAPFYTPAGDSDAVRGAVPEFRDALFAIPQLGQISPPTRTKWGWDLILWWDERPPTDQRPTIFGRLLPRYFLSWSKQIGDALGVHVSVDEARLEAAFGDEVDARAAEAPR